MSETQTQNILSLQPVTKTKMISNQQKKKKMSIWQDLYKAQFTASLPRIAYCQWPIYQTHLSKADLNFTFVPKAKIECGEPSELHYSLESDGCYPSTSV